MADDGASRQSEEEGAAKLTLALAKEGGSTREAEAIVGAALQQTSSSDGDGSPLMRSIDSLRRSISSPGSTRIGSFRGSTGRRCVGEPISPEVSRNVDPDFVVHAKADPAAEAAAAAAKAALAAQAAEEAAKAAEAAEEAAAAAKSAAAAEAAAAAKAAAAEAAILEAETAAVAAAAAAAAATAAAAAAAAAKVPLQVVLKGMIAGAAGITWMPGRGWQTGQGGRDSTVGRQAVGQAGAGGGAGSTTYRAGKRAAGTGGGHSRQVGGGQQGAGGQQRHRQGCPETVRRHKNCAFLR